MQIADVMVSDVSSAFMEFILLDKPVVLFNNPNQTEYVNYDPKDIEYAWRDVGIQASNMEEVLSGVKRSLANPTEYSHKRKFYGDQLITARDGKSSGRIIDAVKELLDGKLSSSKVDRELTRVIISANHNNVRLLRETISSLVYDGGENVRITIDTDLIDDTVRESLLMEFGSQLEFRNGRALQITGENSECKYSVHIQSGITAKNRWLFRLVNHLRRDENIDVVFPLAFGGSKVQDPALILEDNKQLSNVADVLDSQLKGVLVAEKLLPIPTSPAPFVWVAVSETPSGQALLNNKCETELQGIDLQRSAIALDVVMDFNNLSKQSSKESKVNVKV